MRVNYSYPGEFTTKDQRPYITVTWDWEEAKKQLEELCDQIPFTSKPTQTEELIAGLTKVFNNDSS